MAEEYVRKEVCDVQIKNTETTLNDIKTDVKSIFSRLNYFMIIVIATLLAALTDLAEGFLK